MSSNRNGLKRRRTPRVEGLEARELLAMGTYSVRPAGPTPVNFGALAAAAAQANAAGGAAGAKPFAMTGGTGGGGSSAAPVAQPTPQELARQRFVAKIAGSYFTGHGRFTDQAFQVAMLGTGGSNQSLHLNLQLVFFFPTDTTQPVTGVASLTMKNTSSSGNAIGLDLTADAQQPGFHGLPTHFTWTLDNGFSGGTYAGASGQGTLDIRYHPSGKGPLHGFGQGTVALTFQGMINSLGVTNILFAPGNRPQRP